MGRTQLIALTTCLLLLSCRAGPSSRGACCARSVGALETPVASAVVEGAGRAPKSAAEALRPIYAAIDDASLPIAPPGVALPAPEAVLSTISVASCSKQTYPIPLLRDVAAMSPDLFLYAGDNVYGDAHSGDVMLPELRQAYAELAAHPDFLHLWSKVPFLTTWDDHDYGLNDGGATFSAKEFSERIYERFWRLPKDAAARTRPGVYDSHAFGPVGKRVQVILLDTRFFRSALKPSDAPGTPGRERYVPDDTPSKTMLGDAQWAWLARELAKPADIRLVVSSIQVIADGHGWEAWRNLPRERDRLYELVRTSGAKGVIFLSGDRHRAGIYRVAGKTDYPLHELTSSSLNAPVRAGPEAGPLRLNAMIGEPNYGSIRIDWDARKVLLTVHTGPAEQPGANFLMVSFGDLGL